MENVSVAHPAGSGGPILQVQQRNWIIGAVAIVVSVLVLWIGSRRTHAPPAGTREIPGPWYQLPVVGFMPFLGSKPYIKLWQMTHRYGAIFQLRIGNRRAVVLNGVETIKAAFLHNAEAFAGRPDFKSSTFFNAGKSLTFMTYSSSWNVHRKAASRVLSTFVNNKHYPIDSVLHEQAVLLANKLTETDNVNAFDRIENCVTNVVYQLCFGREDVTSDPIKQQMTDVLRGLRHVLTAVNLYDILPTWLSWPLRGTLMRFHNSLKVYDRLAEDKINSILSANGGYSPGHPRCIVDAMQDVWNDKEQDLQNQLEDNCQQLTREQLVATVQDLIGAGSETIVNFFYWAILYMAKYPDIQERLKAEVGAKIGTRAPTSADRLAMPFVESFIWEVVRHSSLVPLALPHATVSNVVVHDMFIPKNTFVIANLYSTSVDPAVWKNPDKFLPDRMLCPNSDAVDRDLLEQLLCFSVGRRKCLGAELARQTMFLTLTVLVQKCNFVQLPDQPLSFDSTFMQTNSARPYYVRVTAVEIK